MNGQKYDVKQDIYIVSKTLSTKNVLTVKEKKKLFRGHHLNQVIKVYTTITTHGYYVHSGMLH